MKTVNNFSYHCNKRHQHTLMLSPTHNTEIWQEKIIIDDDILKEDITVKTLSGKVDRT